MQSLLNGYNVSGIAVKPGLVLSPMSGITTRPFRRFIKELNPGAVGLTVSEFISVEALSRQVPRSLKMMERDVSEDPYCIQIFGFEISRMCEAARMVEDFGADILDINCGCPAPKVVKKGGGCELMRNPQHLSKLIEQVRRSISIPITIKIRAGWDANSLNAIEIAKIAEGQGAAAITIHGRSRQQMYRGMADWTVIRRVREELSIPVLGSGDVVCAQSASERLTDSSADGLFIGRAAMYDPFVFRRILDSGVGDHIPDLRSDTAAVVKILRRYIELMLEDFEPRSVVGKLKQLVSQMCKGHLWRKLICRATTFEQQIAILDLVESGHLPDIKEQENCDSELLETAQCC